MIVVGFVIGMGIFRTATDAAQASATPVIFFTAWILGGFVAFCGALTYAEIGSRYPVTGGYYKIFSYAYHPSVAFALNCVILFSNAASLSGVAIIGSEYLLSAILGQDYPSYYNSILGIAAIGTFYGLNVLGLQVSSRAQNVLMMVKLAMLALILLAGIVLPQAVSSGTPEFQSIGVKGFILSLASALVAVSFTYGGYQQSINFGEEVEQPSRTVPKGIMLGILVVIAIYVLVNLSYFSTIGFEQLKSTKGIASVIAYRLLGTAGERIFSVLLFVAVLAYVNVLMLSNPRVMYAMADDGVLPGIFQKKYGKHKVLLVNLTIFAFLSILTLMFASTFDRILGFVMFLDSVGMVTSAATLFFMRKRKLGEERSGIYRMKWFPLATIIFITAYLLVCGSIIVNTPHLALMGSIVFVGFLGLYLVIRKMFKRNNSL